MQQSNQDTLRQLLRRALDKRMHDDLVDLRGSKFRQCHIVGDVLSEQRKSRGPPCADSWGRGQLTQSPQYRNRLGTRGFLRVQKLGRGWRLDFPRVRGDRIAGGLWASMRSSPITCSPQRPGFLKQESRVLRVRTEGRERWKTYGEKGDGHFERLDILMDPGQATMRTELCPTTCSHQPRKPSHSPWRHQAQTARN